ncbi:polyhydroxyalkanoate synthesis repressor PhaR, partial [Immundisolibacter sp.]|uniref:polyhydroxyalkanoate synthesis repressor PhaR n=1 Tax=Immundisolibacter sp. TaxID=1934948 RepID=UPI0026325829
AFNSLDMDTPQGGAGGPHHAAGATFLRRKVYGRRVALMCGGGAMGRRLCTIECVIAVADAGVAPGMRQPVVRARQATERRRVSGPVDRPLKRASCPFSTACQAFGSGRHGIGPRRGMATFTRRSWHRVRILKKYPNRRLYDTSQSCFVALEDVKRLVLSGEPFEVHDSKTGEDITRSVLLQIIAEQEADGGGSLLTDEVLKQLIRFYGDSLHGLLREYLERSVSLFREQQGVFHEQLRSMLSAHPLNLMPRPTEQNGDPGNRMAGALRADVGSGATSAKK